MLDNATTSPPEPADIPQPSARSEKRARGRPPLSDEDRAAAAARRAAETPDASEQPKARAGGAKKPSSAEVDRLATQLVGFHQILATLTKMPSLAIQKGEAVMLAESGLAVAAEFDLAITGKYAALGTFAFTAASIYGPRLFVIVMQTRAQQRAHANGATINPDGSPA